MSPRVLVLFTLVSAGCTRPNDALRIGDDGTGTGSGGGSPGAGGSTGGSADLAGVDLTGAPTVDAGVAGPARDYDHDGPTPLSDYTASVTRPGRGGFTVRVYLPSTSGAHGVVVLSSGLLQPATGYASYGKRLASFDLIAVLRDDPGPAEQTSDVALDIAYLVDTWLPSQNKEPGGKLSGKLDLARIGLAGHSRGGQASLLAAEEPLKGKLKGFFGLDPVDTPAGGVSARGALGGLGIPSVFLGELTDSGAGGLGGQSCAPAADNFQVLYGAAPSPSVAITALGADHTQFEDPAGCMLCGFCTKGSADGSTVLALSLKYLSAFFGRELLGDSGVGAGFGGVGATADIGAGRIQVTSK